MSTRVEWTRQALRDMRRLEGRSKTRILNGVEQFAHEGIGDVKRLQGRQDYRLRVGSWRVVFELRRAEADAAPVIQVMYVTRVGHRRDVYR